MTNMIRKTGTAIRGGPGGAGIYVMSQKGTSPVVTGAGRIFIDRQGGVPEPLPLGRVQVLGASVAARTLTGADDGITVIANNSAATVTVTLPKASTVGVGYRARVYTGVLPGAGAGTTITPNAADNFVGGGLTKTAGQTLVNSAASDALGDQIEVVSDGVTKWFITAKTGTWA